MIEAHQKKLTELEKDNRRREFEVKENKRQRNEDMMKHDELLLEVSKLKTGSPNYGK